jgi:hypothetical protein
MSLVLLLTVLIGLQVPGSSRPDVVVIKGVKDPQLIPEYLMWRNAFDVLNQASRHNKKFVLHALDLPETDKRIVVIEARAQGEREVACQERQTRRVEALKAADTSMEGINKELQQIALACRQEVLDAKDRVMRLLSPESQLILQTWAEERRSGLTVYVFKHEMEWFRLPR